MDLPKTVRSSQVVYLFIDKGQGDQTRYLHMIQDVLLSHTLEVKEIAIYASSYIC